MLKLYLIWFLIEILCMFQFHRVFDFDIELALEFGIPLLNVKDFDDISSFDGMKGVLKKLEAKL